MGSDIAFTKSTSDDAEVRGDLRSATLGLLSLGVLAGAFGEDEIFSRSDPGILSWHEVRGVPGDFL